MPSTSKRTSKPWAVRCGYFLGMAKGQANVARDVTLVIEGSTISQVSFSKKLSGMQILDYSNHVILPGFVNGHTHLAMTLFRGLADDLPFAQWLHDFIIPMEFKYIDRKAVRLGVELAALELIRCGVTTVLDAYFFEVEAARTLSQAGLRGYCAQHYSTAPSPGTPKGGKSGDAAFLELYEEFHDHPRVRPCAFAHAPYSCDDDLLRHIAEQRDTYRVPLSIHVAEPKHEAEESLKQHGVTSVERLSHLGVTGPTSIFAHAVHLSPKDLQILVQSNTAVITNPESNMKLGVGTAPVPELRKLGVRVGLGTDGAASNNNLNILLEADTLAKVQKLSHANNTAMSAHDALSIATYGGAQALGLDKAIGSLEPGKQADFIALRTTDPHMVPVHDICSSLIYSATGLENDLTVVAGKILYRDGEFKTLEQERIARASQRFANTLKI